MKQLAYRILLVAFVAGILARSVTSIVWQGWFYTHQKEITASSCINKAKPSLHCDGKCQLAKQLKAIEQSNEEKESPALPTIKMQELHWIFQGVSDFEIEKLPSLERHGNLFAHPQESFAKDLVNDVFRPPIG